MATKNDTVIDVSENSEVPEVMKEALSALAAGALSAGSVEDLCWAIETAYLLGRAGKCGEAMMDARFFDHTTVRQAAA